MRVCLFVTVFIRKERGIRVEILCKHRHRGTAVKYGVLDENGTFAEKDKMETRAQEGGAAILEKAVGIVQQYLDAYRPAGICISTAGMVVDREKGEIFYAAPLIPDYAGTNFKNTMEKKFGIPCEVENDVRCAGLAESISGAARGKKYAVCLTIGTGIGGAIILDGKVFHGASGSACEVGYMKMDDSDFQSLGANSSILSKKVAQKNRIIPENGMDTASLKLPGRVIKTVSRRSMSWRIAGKGNRQYLLCAESGNRGAGRSIMTQEDYRKDRVQRR